MAGSSGEVVQGGPGETSLRHAWPRAWLEQRQGPGWSGPFWRLALRGFDTLQNRLSGSAFTRNVSVLLISTVLGQAAGVLLSPLLTRIFSPEQFGDLSVYSSILFTFGGAACLRYEIAIPLAQNDTDGANLIAATGLALLVCTAAMALACWLLPDSVLDSLDASPAGSADAFGASMRLLLPIGLFVFGLFTLLLYIATWTQNFTILARSRISQGIGGPVSQIALGLLGMGSTGLALGFVVGQTAGTTLLFKRLILERWATMRLASRAGIGQALWTHRAYPLITSWATVVDSLGGGTLLYLIIAHFYPGPVAGYLFLAERVVARPLVMISNSMLLVFIGELGRFKLTDPAKLRQRFRQITSKQFMIGLAWVVVINVVSVAAFPAIFGDKWAAAVPYLLVISATHLATNVIQSVCNTLQALNRQVLAASWQVGRVVCVCLGFVACHATGSSPLAAIVVYSAIQVVACIIMYFLIRASIDRLQSPAGPIPS